MKRITVVLLIILFFLSSCSKIQQSEYINFDTFHDAIYNIDEEISQVAVCNNLAFLLATDKIIRLDLISGEKSVIEVEGVALGCDDSKLFVIFNENLLICSHDGTELDRMEIDFEIKAGKISADGNTILISADNDTWYGLQSQLYQIDLEKRTCDLIDRSWINSEYFNVKSISYRKGVANIVYAYSIDVISGSAQFKAASYNLKDRKIISQFDLPNNVSACIGSDGNAYYSSSFIKNGTKNCIVMCTPESLFSTVRYIPKDICNDTYIAVNTFVTECGYVLWSNLNKSIITLSLSSDNDSISVIAPQSLIYDLDTVVNSFEEEYGITVNISRYTDETYTDKLRTKLLAGDDDFDIFIVDSGDKFLLDSLLRNRAYQSLNDLYDEYNTLYSGIRELMTDSDENIFGVPICFSGFNIMEKCADVDLPENFTHAQITEVCDLLPQGYALFSDPYPTIRLVTDYIQECRYAEKEINEQGLTELFATLKKINDDDKLFSADFFGNKTSKSILKYSYSYFDGVLSNRDITVSEENLTALPTVSGTSYINLDSCMMLNLNSNNKTNSLIFLSFILNEDIIYNNSLNPFMLMGKELERNTYYVNFSQPQISYLEKIPEFFIDIKPYTILTTELDNLLRDEILPKLFSGELSAEEAAKKTVAFINYTVYE